MNDIAMIGAGISGLTCARSLSDAGCNVVVFEKSRGAGGRVATRRTELGDSNLTIVDHGAQYFTVRHERMAEAVDRWRQWGVVALWDGRIGVSTGGVLSDSAPSVERWVGTPTMSAIGKFLAHGLDVRLQTRVTRMDRNEGRWQLFDEEDRSLGQFATVLSCAPPAQSAALLVTALRAHEETGAGRLLSKVQRVTMTPCWAVAVTFEERLSVPYDGLFVRESTLSWLARDSSKPGRGDVETWVLHASGSWSSENEELPAHSVGEQLTTAFWKATGAIPQAPKHVFAHRWRFAAPVEPLPEPHLFDPVEGLGCCGDWCGGPRVEGAYLSGLSLAKAVLTTS
jgi:renalase